MHRAFRRLRRGGAGTGTRQTCDHDKAFGKVLYFAIKTPIKISLDYPETSSFKRMENFNMSDLQAQFDAAVANSKNLSERPDNMTLLRLYALYKQASAGDNTEKKPGITDMVGRAKWEAWNTLKGTPGAEAMQQYIDLIESLS